MGKTGLTYFLLYLIRKARKVSLNKVSLKALRKCHMSADKLNSILPSFLKFMLHYAASHNFVQSSQHKM